MHKLFFVFLLIGFTSCNTAEQEKPGTESTAQTSRPDTVQTSFQIEGMAERIRMYLVQTPESFPIQFSTYVPIDMQTKVRQKENSIRITAAFGRQLSPQAYLSIVALPAQLTAKQAKGKVADIAQSSSSVVRDSKAYSWTEAEYPMGNEKSGFLALAQADNNRWFYIKASYPPEYGDGMGPRINLIIENWQWSKTEKPLNK